MVAVINPAGPATTTTTPPTPTKTGKKHRPLPALPVVKEWPTEIDSRDKGTADDWVPRHPGLIRLTGKHPFNAEPNPKTLVDAGFITPVPIHYVRNHGPVPKLTWENHRLTVSGLGVTSPHVLSMDELAAMEARTLPVTLVCAGNRRKEVNMTRQSKGFSWGPAAVSTSLWTGVPLHALLKHCGIDVEVAGRDAWVTFDGPEAELPKGVYGTSIPLLRAMDPAAEVMVAFGQNGEKLKPDHGFPVRIIIPGYIGGRMVKWLTRITVASEESDSYYHYYDNRLLPSMVDPERAEREGWWHRPDYIINDLNLNSAITHPTHNEEVVVGPHDSTYRVRGYAYSGGGRRVRRVELSFDEGTTWEVVQMSDEEYPTEHGKFYCWRLWELDVDVLRLLTARSMMCRAWDDCQNTQPRDLTWSVTGMMNNCWFRVNMAACRTSSGALAVRMEHPAPVGVMGGWMVKALEAGEATAAAGEKSAKVAEAAATTPQLARIHPSELPRHNTKDDCWIVVKGKVYDVTSYIAEHPGGVGAIVNSGGMDVTEDFEAIHSTNAWKLLEKYVIGVLDPTAPLPAGPVEEKTDVVVVTPSGAPTTPKSGRMTCRLASREVVGTDIVLLRFALPDEEQYLGMAVGHHISLRVRINGRLVLRSYTPVGDGKGYFDLLVRVYRANEHPKFPDGGVMSLYLDSMPIGDTITVDEPHGSIKYEAPGLLSNLGDRFNVRHFAAVAGGTGITPIMQVIRAILDNKDDPTTISLVYAARSPHCLMLFDELNALSRHDPRLKVWYTVDTLEEKTSSATTTTWDEASWPYSTGFITQEMLSTHFPPAGEDTAVLMCGPPPMLKFAVKPALDKLGHAPNLCFTF